MIDITDGEASVVQTRQRIHKHYDIDVTIGTETQNLEITIYHEEDLDGSRPQLKLVNIGGMIGGMQFDTIEDGTDVGNDISVYLEDWFDKSFPAQQEETQKDFDDIFEAVWEYIESRNLY